MITKKYNYKSLYRKNVDGKRFYVMEGTSFDPMPSVTTILDSTKPQEKKDVLDNWRKNVGHHRAQQITTEAAHRGTRMHKYLEIYIDTGEYPIPGSNPYAIQSNKMGKEIVKCGLCNVNEYWGIEVPLCFPEIYAGTTDCVGLHKKEESIIDFKQTNKPKKEEWIDDYFMQLTAYAESHNELYGSNIKKGVIMMCSKDFKYQEFVLEGNKFEKFRSAWWHRVEEYYQKHHK